MTLLISMIACMVPLGLSHGRSLRDLIPMIAAPAAMAMSSKLVERRVHRACLVTLGLFSSAAVYVALVDGLTESHFAFFVLVGAIALYQDWRPFVLGVTFVLAHHAVLGTVSPRLVFAGHQHVQQPSLGLPLIHAAFLLASTVATVIAWKATEVEARRDALTGLPNRRVLAERVDEAMTLSNDSAVGLLFLDLCGFKKVNDVYGHEAGDRLLIDVARRLEGVTRRCDTLSRVGGDEFALVLPDVSRDQAEAVARLIETAIAAPFTVDGRNMRIAASIGVFAASGRATVTEMLRSADLAMYASKRRFGDSGGFTVFTDQMRDDARAALELELDLGECIEHDELVVLYQPVVDIVSSRIVGAEALVRWDHPTLGMLRPDLFIAAAERSGEIVPIGRHVLRESVAQLSRWNTALAPQTQLSMHVNVSTRQLEDPSFVTEVSDALRCWDIEPSRLVLEITESAALNSFAGPGVLHQLKQLGVRLALDDFGTGYSSLSYLSRLPVDEIKIDKSFTDDVPHGPNMALLAGVLALAGQIGVTAVIEGIEHQEQVRELIAMGARVGQGYLFDRPLNAAQFGARLTAPVPGLWTDSFAPPARRAPATLQSVLTGR